MVGGENGVKGGVGAELMGVAFRGNGGSTPKLVARPGKYDGVGLCAEPGEIKKTGRKKIPGHDVSKVRTSKKTKKDISPYDEI